MHRFSGQSQGQRPVGLPGSSFAAKPAVVLKLAVPRDFRLEDWENQAIIGFHLKNPLEGYADYDNNVRLNSATSYTTPKDMLAGHQQEIHAERDRKLEAARKQQQIRRQQAA